MSDTKRCVVEVWWFDGATESFFSYHSTTATVYADNLRVAVERLISRHGIKPESIRKIKAKLYT